MPGPGCERDLRRSAGSLAVICSGNLQSEYHAHPNMSFHQTLHIPASDKHCALSLRYVFIQLAA